MQKRIVSGSIVVLSFLLGASALAASTNEVVILSCGTVAPPAQPCPPMCAGTPVEGINVASFSAKVYSLPSSVSIGSACAAALADLIGSGFMIVNVQPVGAGFGATNTLVTTPQITYTLTKGK